MDKALAVLTKQGVEAYIESARVLGKMGRGVEPILIFLEEWPSVAEAIGEQSLPDIMDSIRRMSKSPNGKAIAPFLQSLPMAARRMHSAQQMQDYLNLILDFMDRTTGSIHGKHQTFASPGLPEFFQQIPFLVGQLSLDGLKNWVEYGIRNYNHHPDRQCDYFSLQSADSRAVLQRERHGTLLADSERKLDLYLLGLWQDSAPFIPYSTAFDELRKPVPYYDQLGIRLPDVYNVTNAIPGIDCYRAVLAHIAAHRRWTEAVFADNLSPFQRIATEVFEDSRVEFLAMQEYPGLGNLWRALHPVPKENACPEGWSAIRHRLSMLSRALLDPEHGFTNFHIIKYAKLFRDCMPASTGEMVELGVKFITETRVQSDLGARVYFEDTEVAYRDDNRHMWKFIEEGDEEEAFDEKRKARLQDEIRSLPPRHYPEWDYASQTYRPDWASVYEALHPQGNAADIDALLAKHDALAKRLKRMLDALKPQDKVRIRYQEEGSELDLDVALRSLIDFKSGSTPDPRINMSHKNNNRDISVMLLLDLSESLNEKVMGCEQSVLELSREAVSLLAWAIEKLGDPFAIAGFNSNTRHEVRYLHIKGYGEHWGDAVKGRLAAMEAGFSTRMGAAMRHSGHYLENQRSDKKLLLILTDGQPADIDTGDERLLIEDARQAVKELDQKGVYSYCINLDPRADEYVSDIFGTHYTVIDNIGRLPERLSHLFMALTK